MSCAISIVVPVFNVSQYLAMTLDSILRQDFQDWECVCVDDGSTDGSAKILDDYARRDSRFRVFHRANIGVSGARNFALRNIHGRFVTFADGDDVLRTNRLSRAWEVLKTDRFDLLRTDVTFWPEGTAVSPAAGMVLSRTIEGPSVPQWGWETFLHAGQVWRIFIRRTCIGKILFPEDVRIWEDALFCLQLLPNLRTVCQNDDDSYVYRLRSSSAWHQSRRTEDAVGIQIRLAEILNAQAGVLFASNPPEVVRLAYSLALWQDLFDWLRYASPEVRKQQDAMMMDRFATAFRGRYFTSRAIPGIWRLAFCWIVLFHSSGLAQILIRLGVAKAKACCFTKAMLKRW